MSRRGRSRAGHSWAYRAARAVVLAAVAVTIAPVTLVAAVAMTLGWLTGWPPRRLYGAALWCLPMAVAWLAAAGADVRGHTGMFGIERARGFPAGIAAWPWWPPGPAGPR